MNYFGTKTSWLNVTSYKWKLTNWRLLRYLYASNSDKITLKRRIRGRCYFIFDYIVVIEHFLIQSIQNGGSLHSYAWSTVDLTATFSQWKKLLHPNCIRILNWQNMLNGLYFTFQCFVCYIVVVWVSNGANIS